MEDLLKSHGCLVATLGLRKPLDLNIYPRNQSLVGTIPEQPGPGTVSLVLPKDMTRPPAHRPCPVSRVRDQSPGPINTSVGVKGRMWPYSLPLLC
jgi:hypothetical protein